MAHFHVFTDVHDTAEGLRIRHVNVQDVLDALRLGFADFWEKPSHIVFLCLIYPIAGFILFKWAFGQNYLQLIYPLITGFALVGPFAALGLYEISRRRESGLDTSWIHALKVWRSPAVPAIAVVGGILVALFLAWVFTAQMLYATIYSPTPPDALLPFLVDVLTTTKGWTLIIVGNLVGFFFALAALVVSAISLPLLLDRDVGAVPAIKTSIAAFVRNPGPILLWGFIVAAGLVLGSLPFLVGLALVLPILAHATWHLYRKVVDAPAV
ncbi:DUF2189 domain-containing protein [Roseibium salinum]|uniref:DUF2189 domain-containing protein n=1 Tax=Roseibium salinum TaxID=1604349 RepID=A0ABT3R5C9_9HYPH|nr:DUF2189 domain-containing protein [Roseibium sp. DSM 29163]MCX2724352.1 DUF2189 domain-containing protein [Roseibium sp. DSM 29163]